MMKNMLLALLLISLASMAFAQNGDGDDLSQFFNDTRDELRDEGDAWVEGQVGGVGAGASMLVNLGRSFGPGQCGDEWVETGAIVGKWIIPAVMVIIIVIMGIAIIYMMGQLFSLPNLIAIAKDEAFQVGVTIARILIIIAALSAGHTWYTLAAQGSTDDIYGNPYNTDMMDAAMAFARLMVSDMINHYSMLVMYNMVVHTIFSSTMWFGVTWRAMYSFNLGPVLKPLIDIIGSALQFLSLGMSSWLLHVVTLCLIKRWMWVLFIPMSILLRAFPHTRNAGEALFALAFALALFYPFMFIFDYEAHKIMVWNIADPKDAVSNFIHRSGLLSVLAPVIAVMFLMAGVFMPFFLGAALTIGFELIYGAIYYIVIMSLLLPFLNIFVTLTAAREMASFFQVDVNFMSFLKII